MAKGNLFSKAKTQAQTTKSKKDEKVRIKIEDPSFFDKVSKLETLNDQMKSAKAKADVISDELRDLGKTEWSKLYDKTNKNPGSVMLEQMSGEDNAQLMYIPSDKYLTITPERAEELRETYGDDIIEEKTTFSFDNDMIEKYGEIISNLIENCQDIDDDDKSKIIKAVDVFSIAKGTIDSLTKYGKAIEMVDVVRPVISLKNIEVVKG